jgi:hypothetical protein
MKMTVFWDVALCSLVDVYDVSEVLAASIIRAMMKAASTSEASVNFYQITRRNITEDSPFHVLILLFFFYGEQGNEPSGSMKSGNFFPAVCLSTIKIIRV